MSPVVVSVNAHKHRSFDNRTDYSSFNGTKAVHGVNYHGREYDYCVSHLVIWLLAKRVSSVDVVPTTLSCFFFYTGLLALQYACTLSFSFQAQLGTH